MTFHPGAQPEYQPGQWSRPSFEKRRRRSAPLRRNDPSYRSPKRQFRILPRHALKLGGVLGAALTAYELYELFHDPKPVSPPAWTSVPAEVFPPASRPELKQRGRISEFTLPLARVPEQFRSAPIVVNVPQEWVQPITTEVIERGPEFRLSFGTATTSTGIIARVRRSVLDGTRKRRRDGKSQDHALYVASLRFFNRTYGVLSEVHDFYEAVAWNAYQNGNPIAQRGFGYGDISVDWEGVSTDLFMNEIVDRSIGKTRQAEKKFLRREGYRGWQMPTSIINKVRYF